MRERVIISVLLFTVFCFSSLSYSDVPQMINYQGKLTTPQGALVDTTVSITFAIYTNSTGGDSLWSETQSSVQVEKGVFSVLLGSVNPIPDSAFDGSVRYLGVKVGTDPEMIPRKMMVSVGYAYKSEYADTADYAQTAVDDGDWTISGSDIYCTVSGNVSIGTTNPTEKLQVSGKIHSTTGGFKFPDGSIQTTAAIGGIPDNDWILIGDILFTISEWGIARKGNVLYGIHDSTHVNLGVACTTGTSGQDYKYVAVGGGLRNVASDNYCVVSGGGKNVASGAYSVISGGRQNKASRTYSTVSGGTNGEASGEHATVGGGDSNRATYYGATVAGGVSNEASHYWTTVGGGTQNIASGQQSFIGGGISNNASAQATVVSGGYFSGATMNFATVGGGAFDSANGVFATVSGGERNIASFSWATIGGGGNNTASETGATVGGGRFNQASGYYSVVGGGGGDHDGMSNVAQGQWSVIVGGFKNTASGNEAVISGGGQNYAGGLYATIGGGSYNTAGSGFSTIAGGTHNNTSHNYATIGGGALNSASGAYATVPGGLSDTAAGEYSFAAGRQVRIESDADYTFAFGRDFSTSTSAAAIFYDAVAGMKVGIQTTSPTARLDVDGTNGYNQVRMRTPYTPTGTSDVNGNVGDIAWDDNYFYVKTNAGWKRVALSTW